MNLIPKIKYKFINVERTKLVETQVVFVRLLGTVFESFPLCMHKAFKGNKDRGKWTLSDALSGGSIVFADSQDELINAMFDLLETKSVHVPQIRFARKKNLKKTTLKNQKASWVLSDQYNKIRTDQIVDIEME